MSEYSVRYIFDSRQQCMHISGGLGFACLRLAWKWHGSKSGGWILQHAGGGY